MIVTGGVLASLSLERVSFTLPSILEFHTLFARLPSRGEAARNIGREERARCADPVVVGMTVRLVLA